MLLVLLPLLLVVLLHVAVGRSRSRCVRRTICQAPLRRWCGRWSWRHHRRRVAASRAAGAAAATECLPEENRPRRWRRQRQKFSPARPRTSSPGTCTARGGGRRLAGRPPPALSVFGVSIGSFDVAIERCLFVACVVCVGRKKRPPTTGGGKQKQKTHTKTPTNLNTGVEVFEQVAKYLKFDATMPFGRAAFVLLTNPVREEGSEQNRCVYIQIRRTRGPGCSQGAAPIAFSSSSLLVGDAPAFSALFGPPRSRS